ncbi:helix-turn-helix domain-containing protein [Actinoplanes rectilineatus]|uniref:helix-turn-helix domain-containing protein n=1 Tax=Actinoplanes rectilineatus TaxID=113571 RepID=UPI000AF2EB53|nr:helix-turn-helix domain-containing protein [Actinoplanes rectilineatus]
MVLPHRDMTKSVPEVFTIDEAATILKVKKSWLERKAASGEIPVSLLGGSYHFSPDHLWQIFAQFERKPTSGPSLIPAQDIPMIRRKKNPPAEIPDLQVTPLRPRPRRLPRQVDIAA